MTSLSVCGLCLIWAGPNKKVIWKYLCICGFPSEEVWNFCKSFILFLVINGTKLLNVGCFSGLPLASSLSAGNHYSFLHLRTEFFAFENCKIFLHSATSACYLDLGPWTNSQFMCCLPSHLCKKQVRFMICALHLTGLSLVEAASRDFQSSWYMGDKSARDPLRLITVWMVLSSSFLKGPFLLTLINLP